MKTKIALTIGFVCFFAVSVWAKGPKATTPKATTTSEQIVKPIIDTQDIAVNLQNQLGLTEKQLEAITPIIDEENKKLSKIFNHDQMSQWTDLLYNYKQKHTKSKHAKGIL